MTARLNYAAEVPEALAAMRGLRAEPACVIGGKTFRWVSRALGMAPALRARSLVAGYGNAERQNSGSAPGAAQSGQ